MSTRWRLAQLVRKRIESIIKDTVQLQDLMGMPRLPALHDMRHALYQAKSAAEAIEQILELQGEAEDDRS